MINWRALYGGVGHDTQSWLEEDTDAPRHGGLLDKIRGMEEEEQDCIARIRLHEEDAAKYARQVELIILAPLWCVAAVVAIIIVSEMAR